MFVRYLAVVIIAFGLVMVGCRTAPIYQVTDAPIVTASNKHSIKAVRQAIFRAGATRGWHMRTVGKRRIEGSITVRKATAQVEITYDWNRYNIRYKNSQNLNYDGVNIRGGYNRWIRKLEEQIRIELSGL